MKTRRLILARHGQTEWNSIMRYQGKTDVPLNSRGRQQAARLAARLASWDPEAFFTTPLSRAVETAGIVHEALLMEEKPELEIIRDLSEIDFGDWEGLTIPEIEEAYPEIYREWREDPSRVVPPGGESFPQVLARVGRAFGTVLSGSWERALVVGHGGVMRAALVGLLGVPPSLVWRMRMDNCSILGIDFWGERAMLAFFNDSVHLHVESEKEAGRIPLPD